MLYGLIGLAAIIVVIALAMAIPAITEGLRAGECIIDEAPSARSRETITVISGAGVLGPCTVLGKHKYGAISQAFSGTGNGTMGTLTRQATNCVAGDWKVRCINAITNGGIFSVVDPNGVSRGTVAVGVAFANGIGFTIADGSTDFAVGDVFTVTVAAGSGKYDEVDQDAVTGLQDACAVLFDEVDATSADVDAVAFVRDCVVNSSMLDWGTKDPDAGEITAFKDDLKAVGIIVREAI